MEHKIIHFQNEFSDVLWFFNPIFHFLPFIYKTHIYVVNIPNVMYLYVSPQRAATIFTFLSPVASFLLGINIV